ncbi:MAG TPA: DinB family protein [bacterium]|nr:DinB family protein [bacterium]
MSTSTVDLAQYFDYLCRAREKLLGWVGSQPAEAYTRSFPFGMGSIRATLVHTASAQWGYTQRLNGTEYRPADNPFSTEKHPTLEPFVAAWSGLNPQTRRALADLGDGSRRIEYVNRMFDPPRRFRTTAGGLAAQLLFHEVHHRAQVMAMLRQFGVPAENLDYSALMFERVE